MNAFESLPFRPADILLPKDYVRYMLTGEFASGAWWPATSIPLSRNTGSG